MGMHDASNLPGPGPGRPKGSKDKPKPYNTHRLIQALTELGYDAVKSQVELYKASDTPASVKYKINETFLKMIYPAVKSIDVSGEVTHHNLNISWDASTQPLAVTDAGIEVTPVDGMGAKLPSDDRFASCEPIDTSVDTDDDV